MKEYKITDEQTLSVSLGKFSFRAGPFAAHSREKDYCADYLNPHVLVSVYKTHEARACLQAAFVCYAKKICFHFVYGLLRSAFFIRSRAGAHNPERSTAINYIRATAFLQVSLFVDKLFPRKITVSRGQFLHLIVV